MGLGQLTMDLTGPGLGWAWSSWARAGLGRSLVGEPVANTALQSDREIPGNRQNLETNV